MRARRTRERKCGPAGNADVRARERPGRDPDDPSHEVERDDADGDDDERTEEPAAHELEDRQREEVKADVAAEDRIRRAERDLIDPAQQHVPLVATREAEKERGNQQEPHEPEGRRKRSAASALGLDDHARHLRTEGEVHVRQRQNKEDRAEDGERIKGRGETPQVDGLEAEATEPEEICEEADEGADQDRDEKDEEDDDG